MLRIDGTDRNIFVPYVGATTDVVLGNNDLTTLGNVGIGTASPDSAFHIKANISGIVGNDYAGQLIIQNPANDVTSNVVITAYESDSSGNPDQQLWYLGSSSSSNSNIIFLNRRNALLQFGTSDSNRMTILGNGNVGIGTTTPDTTLQVVGDCKFGNDTTNYATFSTSGQLTLVGEAVVWKDINMAGYLLAKPASNFPTVDSFRDEAGVNTTIETYAFAEGKSVHGGFELQHDYKQGTDLVFHIHWQGIAAPSGTDNVQWRINYIVARDGTTLNAAVEIDSPDTAIDTRYKSYRTDFGAITGTDFLIEDQFMFTLTRVASTGDAYAGEALIQTAGIHYRVDTIGSREIDAK